MTESYNRLKIVGDICRALDIDIAGVRSVTIKLDTGVPQVEIVRFLKTDDGIKLAQVLQRFHLAEQEEGR
jgi:hypothetical protein